MEHINPTNLWSNASPDPSIADSTEELANGISLVESDTSESEYSPPDTSISSTTGSLTSLTSVTPTEGEGSSDEEYRPGGGYKITPPPPEFFLKLMGCKICGNIGKKFRQCERGHVLCGRMSLDELAQVFEIVLDKRAKAFNVDRPPKPACKNDKLKVCPFQMKSKTGKEISCGKLIFDGQLELYDTIFAGCIFYCPGSIYGCKEAFESKELLVHIKQCGFITVKKCPTSTCQVKIGLKDFFAHIHDKHGIPQYDGKTNLIKVHQDGEKLEVSQYQWAAASIAFDGNIFLLMIRQEGVNIVIWITQMVAAKPGEKFGCKISIRKIDALDDQPSATTSDSDHDSWIGDVDTKTDWPYKTETHEPFKLHLIRFMKYGDKSDEAGRERYRWDVSVELEAAK